MTQPGPHPDCVSDTVPGTGGRGEGGHTALSKGQSHGTVSPYGVWGPFQFHTLQPT